MLFILGKSAQKLTIHPLQLFAPFKQRPDGTYVFAGAIGDGHMPMLYVEDLGFWVRHVLDNPDKTTTGVELEIASEMVSYPQIVETFTVSRYHNFWILLN